MDESGEVICAGVNQHIAKWVKQKGQEAVLEDSRAKDTLGELRQRRIERGLSVSRSAMTMLISRWTKK